MRTEPTWRIPVGILALLAGLILYGILVAIFAPPLIGGWPVWAQTLVYIVLGVIWIRPLRRFLIWMETGRWG
ncbi:DUF2842 domain-containing protein [Aurantiacibacter poecillastricola]|uniref:DUF2842 domain-containing protein n=1 Tax=Aurantiacibacter poecillastricola TaxID=3064385 RepID=UPI00273EC209|nr:DUF2842 domain-containing protein [Aurantiacibacter sp. 219JJ12-13]MDP5261867.1 DUF2842 domain-containing protein [Aurantiacibacter sp. 219JJ12-13]